MLIVLTTAPSDYEANDLAEKIVRERLGACVQVMPEMRSFYCWEGKLERDEEHLLLIKTLEHKFDELCEFIQANHSYSVPEIVAIGSADVSKPYLSWMKGLLD